MNGILNGIDRIMMAVTFAEAGGSDQVGAYGQVDAADSESPPCNSLDVCEIGSGSRAVHAAATVKPVVERI